MAANEWIYGYLDAIIDAGGAGVVGDDASLQPEPEQGRKDASNNAPVVAQGRINFNPSTYFVEEVISSYDESDLHRTWMKAIAMRNSQHRNVRMENLSWRIWHLARRKKQIALDVSQRLVDRQYEREQGRKTAAEEFSEDFSEGEKEKSEREELSLSGGLLKVPRNLSFEDFSTCQTEQSKRLYIVLISVHGLVRGDKMELGCDSDTGGQVKYVVELARALATTPQVYRVDLLTRQILDPDVDSSYAEPTEMLSPGCVDSESGESSGAYIIRIPCGPQDKYLNKELLWPYVQEFVDAALDHILAMARVLGEQINDGEQFVWPHVIHGHYADAGDIASLLSGSLNVPMVLTGHSLGRNKMEQLLMQGRQSKEDINATYKIMRRIEGEEFSLDASELVITSTKQEIEEQWGLYDGFDVRIERVLRARKRRGVSCHGRYMPRMVVIPPGMDFSNVIAPEISEGGEGDAEGDPLSPRIHPPIWSEISRFFNNPHKPMILAIARPDPKKNITTLLKAFGECRPLRDLANLTLVMGNRYDIDEMTGGNSIVLMNILKLIDKYDLYGQVAYPKHHTQQDVPDIYRLAARTKGVFINPALVEPFGLTLIEAAAHGLPMVATRNGGPVDILQVLNNGLLVDPHNPESIANALLRLVSDRNLWMECRRNGVKNIHMYSWPEHCRIYLARIAQCRMRHPLWKDGAEGSEADADSLGDSFRDVHDISLRLSIDDKILGSGSFDDPDLLPRGENGAENALITSDLRKSFGKFRKEPLNEENEYSTFPSGDKFLISTGNTLHKAPSLPRKRRIFVIAVDAYGPSGEAGEGILRVIREVLRYVREEPHVRLLTGFILSSAMTLSETVSLLHCGAIPLQEFTALVCSSGSELYYPTATLDEASTELGSQFYVDPDYATHIEYRWGGDGLKTSLPKLLASEGDTKAGGNKGELALIADDENSSMHCIVFRVKDPSRAPRVDELRKRFRMCGLRSHIVYCKNRTRLHIMPLFASRSQVLRYLFVRWGVEVSSMCVFIGEMGDTDREELLPGIQKTIIIRGAVEGGCESLLRSSGSYRKEDVLPPNSPNIVRSEGYTAEAIAAALKAFV